MDFLPPEIDAYAGAHCDPENNLLKKVCGLELATVEKVLNMHC